MKTINRVVVHATGTDTQKKLKDFAYENKKPIYHYVIQRDGDISQLCFEPWALNEDEGSVHIAYIGGIDSEGKTTDNRTSFQKEAMFYKLVELSSRYNNLEVTGADGRTNPAFDVKEWMQNYEPTLALDREEMAMAA